MPALQLNKIFYIKRQKVLSGPRLKPIQTDLTPSLNIINSTGHTNTLIGS